MQADRRTDGNLDQLDIKILVTNSGYNRAVMYMPLM